MIEFIWVLSKPCTRRLELSVFNHFNCVTVLPATFFVGKILPIFVTIGSALNASRRDIINILVYAEAD